MYEIKENQRQKTSNISNLNKKDNAICVLKTVCILYI